MSERQVVVVSGVRTAVGKYGGCLKDIPPTALGTTCVKEAVTRAGVSPEDVEQVVFGNVIHTEAKDMYLARVVAVTQGFRMAAPALTVNRLCGSGLQAILSVAQTILLGDATVGVGGGAESNEPLPILGARFALGPAHEQWHRRGCDGWGAYRSL